MGRHDQCRSSRCGSSQFQPAKPAQLLGAIDKNPATGDERAKLLTGQTALPEGQSEELDLVSEDSPSLSPLREQRRFAMALRPNQRPATAGGRKSRFQYFPRKVVRTIGKRIHPLGPEWILASLHFLKENDPNFFISGTWIQSE